MAPPVSEDNRNSGALTALLFLFEVGTGTTIIVCLSHDCVSEAANLFSGLTVRDREEFYPEWTLFSPVLDSETEAGDI